MVNSVEDSGLQDFQGAAPRMISRTDPPVTSVIPKKERSLGGFCRPRENCHLRAGVLGVNPSDALYINVVILILCIC